MQFVEKFRTIEVPDHLIGEVFGSFAQEAVEIKELITALFKQESEPSLTAMPPEEPKSVDEILWNEWVSRPHNLEARQESGGLYGLSWNSAGECEEFEVFGD